MSDQVLKILVAEDDEDDLFLVQELIQDGVRNVQFEIDHVTKFEDILSTLEKQKHDICLLDYRLGSHNGIEILQAIRSRGIATPTILLTGQGDQEIAVQAMKAGANDYLVKSSLNAEVISKTISHVLKISKEEEQRRKVEQVLYNQGLLLQGVAEAANRLLTVNDHELAMMEALAVLGRSAQVDKIYIFQEHPHPDTGDPSFSLRHSWSRQGRAQETNLVNISYYNLGVGEWLKQLGMNKAIYCQTQNLPTDAQQLFRPRRVRAMLLVPIRIDYILWGFVLFGDSNANRTWSKDEESILTTVAASIGGEIKRNRDDQAFRSIVQGTSSQMGDEFFKSLVRNLSLALPARCAVVSELVGESPSRCRIIAGWHRDSYFDKIDFDIKGTPHEEVLAGLFGFYPDRLRELYPDWKELKESRYRSYAGVPFFDSSLNIIGHLCVMDYRSIVDKQRTISILRIFAARAGAELERKRAEETIKNMAHHDALTGLPNRILLNDRISVALAHAKRYNKKAALLFIDFDGFKEINDTLGHAEGDRILREMAGKLQNCLRQEDTVARLGGDEFILLMPEINSRKDAVCLAKKVNLIGQQTIAMGNENFQMSFSIGIALYPDDGSDSTTLFKKADEALYKAKKQGRNSYRFASGEEPSFQTSA